MARILRIFTVWILTPALFSALSVAWGGVSASPSVRLNWKSSTGERDLGDFPLNGLPPAARRKSREKDPKNGELALWDGVSLNWLLNHAMEKLSMEEKAEVDLVILVGKNGERAIIPRGVIVREPLLLAFKRGGKDLGDRGPIYSVVPWSSNAKLTQEPLPFERYFISNVERIELTNAKLFYGPFFLSTRSDPRAVRGERLFVQTCLACHDNGKRNREYPLSLTSGNVHKPVAGLPKFNSMDSTAIKAYFKTLEAEIGQQKAAK